MIFKHEKNVQTYDAFDVITKNRFEVVIVTVAIEFIVCSNPNPSLACTYLGHVCVYTASIFMKQVFLICSMFCPFACAFLRCIMFSLVSH